MSNSRETGSQQGPPSQLPSPSTRFDCGLEAALSDSVIAPVSVPEAVGLKVTEIVQLAFTARLVPQVLVCAKLPEAAMLLNVSAAVPVLLSVTACVALVVPTVWLANVKLAGDKLTTGTAATAAPDTAVSVGVFDALLARQSCQFASLRMWVRS